MAKSKPQVKKVEQVEKVKDLTVNIDMDKLLVPFAILISGLMISLSIIFTMRDVSKTTTNDTTDDKVTDTTGTDTDTEANDGVASVSISDNPYLGDKKKAKVAIVMFSDYECPFCQRHFAETHADLVKNYVDTDKAILVFRNYPLSFHDPVATNEALAAMCVFDQKGNDAYFEFHDSIFENSKLNGEGLATTDSESIKKMEEYAKAAGANVSKFRTCYDDKKFADKIASDIADGSAAGISGTPGFIIGKFDSDGNVKDGIILAGAYPYASFQATLDKVLSE